MTHDSQTSAISDLSPECVGQAQSEFDDEPRHVASSPGSMDENEEMVIIAIRATDVCLGLGRLPAGFYAVVHHGNFEWRTEIKSSSVNDDAVEWSGRIPLPSDVSAIVYLAVYSSFEFEPTLGDGEQLRELTITIKKLLEYSAKCAPFTFAPKDGDVVSPCSSLSIAVQRRKRDDYDPSTLRVLNSHSSTIESRYELTDATNSGHRYLSRYRKQGDKQDLHLSIREFDRALSICPADHPCRAAAQSNLAMAKLILYRVGDAESSLSVALDLLRDALATRPVGHLDRPYTLIQLAAVHLARFEKLEDEVEGARAKEFLHEAMSLSSGESHERRAATFMLQLHAGRTVDPIPPDTQSLVEDDSTSPLSNKDLGNFSLLLLDRFGQSGDVVDLELAIEILKTLVRSTPASDDTYLVGLLNLGVALRHRFDHLGQLSDLADAITTFRDAIELAPDGHSCRLALLNNLGSSLKTRFERLGRPTDLADAILKQREAIDLAPYDHPHKPVLLNNLGNSFISRFKRFGELDDLEGAISKQRDAIDLTPDGHPDKPSRLNNLGISLKTRFDRLGQISDLEQAISMLRDAIELAPNDHLHRPTYLNTLGLSLSARFDHLGQINDLDASISMFLNAIDFTPRGHPHVPSYLNNLGNSFRTRFHRLGRLRDLDDAILRQADAVNLTPHGDPHRLIYLNGLGDSFSTRFDRLGHLSDLEDAISRQIEAVSLTPYDNPAKPIYLDGLGNSLRTRFSRLGDMTDLENAISCQRDAVDLIPDDHPHKPGYLNSLGNSFFTRFNFLGQISDLEHAISRQRDAVDLTPPGHPQKSAYLNNLSNSFRTRFSRLGHLNDLEDAMSGQRRAIDLTPDGHPNKPGFLTNLGNILITRFYRLGQLSDLEDAISTHKDTVELTPHDHPNKPGHLNNLGSSFVTRFHHLGQMDDLEDAISRQRDAVDLTPDSHPQKPDYLSNLGISLRTRFDRIKQISDLEDAISSLGKAVDLTPHSHPHKSGRLNNLGISFKTRFDHLGHLDDLEFAISTLRDAVHLTPDGHSHKPGYLDNLGNSFIARFKCFGQLSDLDDAISSIRDAVELTPHGHPHKPSHLSSLGDFFRLRFERFHEPRSLEQAISLYSHAASSPVGLVNVRFRASYHWITCACRIHHHSLLQAYSVALDLLPQRAWIGLSLSHRYSQLAEATNVVREAAAAALDEGFLETAVEWLEQGRSIVWGELLQLRSSHDELASTHPDHAHRLCDLSAALDHASATHEKALSMHSEQTRGSARHGTESSQHEADTHRRLAIERDKLVQEIRRLPGFEHFLLRKLFSHLRHSAHSGPVVILNAAETRCDALIILAGVDHVIHVSLPNFTLRRSIDLQNTLKGFVRDAREGKRKTQIGPGWDAILPLLWGSVVKPVLDALAFSIPGDLSRIFWCPTGPFAFLPIHAAGLYDDRHAHPGHKVFDFVVSSYTPTLAILSPSLTPTPAARSSSDLCILAVPQPPSDGNSHLPGVATELRYIRDIIRTSPSAQTSLLEASTGTVEEVLDLLQQTDWVHFACHGIQDDVDSGLCLADGRRLKLREMIALSRPRGGLAFLSACQTATGEKHLSDEAVHIAAGMFYAGYGGVIGTMWSISDRLAPVVARDVYARLFESGTRPDYRDAARALHEAIAHARDIGRASFVEWIPFIHVGL